MNSFGSHPGPNAIDSEQQADFLYTLAGCERFLELARRTIEDELIEVYLAQVRALADSAEK